MASKDLDRIDEILARDRSTWTDEEFDLVIEYKVERRLADEEHKIQFAAMQEELLESAEANAAAYEVAAANLEEMKNKAFELLEQASV